MELIARFGELDKISEFTEKKVNKRPKITYQVLDKLQ